MPQSSPQDKIKISRTESVLEHSKKLRSGAVHDLAQKISENADALSVASTVAELYLGSLLSGENCVKWT
jgi:hypothetical protein